MAKQKKSKLTVSIQSIEISGNDPAAIAAAMEMAFAPLRNFLQGLGEPEVDQRTFEDAEAADHERRST